ncbi:hypothetical protein C2E31_05560 [Rhodopirellula baltica]|nr:hypothetical protein C2E31_05560 [Rhodopirellula baltica]
MFNNIHYGELQLLVVDLVKDPAVGSVFQFSICTVHFAICNPPFVFCGGWAKTGMFNNIHY